MKFTWFYQASKAPTLVATQTLTSAKLLGVIPVTNPKKLENYPT